jgi:hypothetical protein
VKTRMKARVRRRDVGVFEGSWMGKGTGGVHVRLFFGGEKGWGLDWIERLVLWLLGLWDLGWALSRDMKEGIWEG